jgi:hypothetical protein
MDQKDEGPVPVVEKEVSLSDVLDAIKELTSTTIELTHSINDMAKEYGLKRRAGVFDGKGIT